MSIENATLIFQIINSTLLAGFFLYLKFVVDRRLKIYDYFLTDMRELNTKIHDRLVEVSELIESDQPIPKKLQKRLRMTGSRFNKYDSDILKSINALLTCWNNKFLSTPDIKGLVMMGNKVDKNTKQDCFNRIEEIKAKADKVCMRGH